MSATISNDVLEIPSGVVSTGLTIGTGGEVFILDGGALTDSLVTDSAYIWVDAGGSVQKISATNGGNLFLEGSATDLTISDKGQFDIYAGGKLTSASLLEKGYGVVYADASAGNVTVSSGGSLMLNGGVADQTVVSGSGSFTVQEAAALAKNTTVLTGGVMRIVNAGTAQGATVDGGSVSVESGVLDGATAQNGSVAVSKDGVIRNATLNGGKLTVSGTAEEIGLADCDASAFESSIIRNLTLNGGQLAVAGGTLSGATVDSGAALTVTGGSAQSVTVKNGQFDAASVSLTDVSIQGGTAGFTGVSVDGLQVGAAGAVSLDEASVIVGNAVFADGASVALSGATVAFDTAVATSTDAQIKGLSAISGGAVYTLKADAEIGVYLLADGADGFNGDVQFGEYTLNVDTEPVKIGPLVYSLSLSGGVLAFTVEEYAADATIAYANSEWSTLADGTEVMIGTVPAVIGVNAFATGDAAMADVAEVADGKVRVTGGTIGFTSGIAKDTVVYSGAVIANSDVAATGSLTVNSGATLAGKATFAEGASITINGTVAFDTAYATAESAQITVHGAPEGKATFTLKVATPEIGTYQLLAGLSTFEDEVAFGEYALSVGGTPVTIDGLDYALSMGAGDVLTLSVTEFVPPPDTTPPTVANVKANTTAPTNQDVVVTADFSDDVELVSSLYKIGDVAEWTPYVSGATVSENAVVFFKAVDASGNESEIAGYTVSNIDKIPPAAPTASADITTPTAEDVYVTAVFSEDSAAKEYSFDGASWIAYVSPIKFTENKAVYFRGKDAAGNVSEIAGYTVSNIDKTTPVVPDTVAPTVTNVAASVTAPTNQDVVVTADFADDVELASSLYRIGEAAEWTPYVSGATVSENAVVYFKAVDASGNESDVVGCTVSNIDKVAPTISDIAPDTTEPTESVVVTAVFADDVELSSKQYRIGDGAWTAYPDGGVSVDMNTTVYFQAIDAAGNETTASYAVTNILPPEQDDTPPVVLNVQADITTPTDQNVTVTAEFTDNVAVASSLYRIGDGAWTDYPVGGVTLSENAVVYFKAVDASGNESEIVGYTVSNIEKTPPEDQDAEAPTLVYAKANITKPTNKDVTVTALFSDNVGVVSTQYRIGDGEWIDYPVGGVTLSENATVYFKASDEAGNESEVASCAVTNIDKTLPDGQAMVYVNVGWAGYDYGTPVETYLGGNATVGVNAFATGDEANAAVDGEGFIMLENGGITFSEFAHNVYVYGQADLVIDNEAGFDRVIVENNGIIYMSKGVMTGCTVLDDGRLYVESGAIVDGLKVDAPQDAGVAVNGGTVKNVLIGCLHTEYDSKYACSMSVVSEGGLAQDVMVTSGGRLFMSSGARVENVTLAGDTENYLDGTLYMEKGATASGVTVSSGGYMDNRGVVDDLAIMDGQGYVGGMVNGAFVQNGTLGIQAGGVASGVNLGESGNMWTVNSAGLGSAYDTEIRSGGSMSNDGYASNTRILDGGKMVVTPNGLAEDTMVKQGGRLDISGYHNVYEDTVYERNGAADGLTAESGAIVNVSSYGRITGQVTVVEGATVTMAEHAILDFDISGLKGSEETPLVSGYSFISGTPDLTLTVSATQASGVYLLADGLTAFDRGIAFGDATLTVDGAPVAVGDITCSLGFADGVLSLTVDGGVVVDNGPDNGWNNELWDKKTKTPNMALYNGDALVIDGDTMAVSIDEKGSVSVERPDGVTYSNFVGKITGQGFNPDTDPADNRKIELETGARLSFSVTSQSAGKFAIYQITETWNEKKEITEYKLKTVQTTKLSLKKNAANVTVDTKAVYLEAGTYFLAMEGAIDKKKDTEGFYNVEMRYVDPAEDKKNQSTKFYTDDDDGSNNWVYDKKNKENPVNPAVYGSDPFVIDADTNHVQVDKAGAVYYEDEHGLTWENFVGFGDDTDFVRIDLDAPSQLSFEVQAAAAAKMIVYCLETGVDKDEQPTYKLTALQTTTLKKQKFEYGEGEEVETFEMYTASTKKLLLDRPADNQQYFIAVQSTNAKKGDEAYYDVRLGEIGEAVIFFTDADDGWNNYVYDKKLGFNEKHYDDLVPTEFMEETTVVMLDSAPVNEDWNNFVGFGDATDYAKIEVTAGMTLSFSLTATDAAKFTIWSLEIGEKKGETTYKMTSLQSTALKKDKETGLYAADTKDYTFKEGGTYFISMESSNAKKGSETYYNVVGNRASFSEAASLDMPELSGSLGGPDAGDALASVGSASGLDDFAGLDDKSAWRSLLA